MLRLMQLQQAQRWKRQAQGPDPSDIHAATHSSPQRTAALSRLTAALPQCDRCPSEGRRGRLGRRDGAAKVARSALHQGYKSRQSGIAAILRSGPLILMPGFSCPVYSRKLSFEIQKRADGPDRGRGLLGAQWSRPTAHYQASTSIRQTRSRAADVGCAGRPRFGA